MAEKCQAEHPDDFIFCRLQKGHKGKHSWEPEPTPEPQAGSEPLTERNEESSAEWRNRTQQALELGGKIELAGAAPAEPPAPLTPETRDAFMQEYRLSVWQCSKCDVKYMASIAPTFCPQCGVDHDAVLEPPEEAGHKCQHRHIRRLLDSSVTPYYGCVSCGVRFTAGSEVGQPSLAGAQPEPPAPHCFIIKSEQELDTCAKCGRDNDDPVHRAEPEPPRGEPRCPKCGKTALQFQRDYEPPYTFVRCKYGEHTFPINEVADFAQFFSSPSPALGVLPSAEGLGRKMYELAGLRNWETAGMQTLWIERATAALAALASLSQKEGQND